MSKKIALLYILFIAFLIVTSGIIHEGVHWVQAMIDGRVEPSKYVFIDSSASVQGNTAYHNFVKSLGFLGFISRVEYTWTTSNIDEQNAFISEGESNAREFWAYTGQFTYVGIMLLILTYYDRKQEWAR